MRIRKSSSLSDEASVIQKSQTKFESNKAKKPIKIRQEQVSLEEKIDSNEKLKPNLKKQPWYKKIPLWGPISALLLLLVAFSFFFQQSNLFEGRISLTPIELLPAETTGSSFEDFSVLETAAFEKKLQQQIVDNDMTCFDAGQLCLHSYSVSPMSTTTLVVSLPQDGDTAYMAQLLSNGQELIYSAAYNFLFEDLARVAYVFVNTELASSAIDQNGEYLIPLTLALENDEESSFDFQLKLLAHPESQINRIQLLKVDNTNNYSFVGERLELTSGTESLFELDLAFNSPMENFGTEDFVNFVIRENGSILQNGNKITYQPLANGRFTLSIADDLEPTDFILEISPSGSFDRAEVFRTELQVVNSQAVQAESALTVDISPANVAVGDSFTATAKKNLSEVPADLTWELSSQTKAKIINQNANSITLRALEAGDLGIAAYGTDDHSISGISALTITPATDGALPTSIKINPSNVRVIQGGQVEFTTTVEPVEANRNVNWRLLTPALGTISNDGRFVAGREFTGTAQIQAISIVDPSVTATATAEVLIDPAEIEINSMQITPSLDQSIYVNDRVQFDYEVEPSGIKELLTDVIWQVEDENIAGVTPKGDLAGLLVARAEGTTYLQLGRLEKDGFVEYDRQAISVIADDPETEEPRVVNLTASQTQLSIKVGQEVALSADVEVVNDAPTDVSWSVVDPDLAAIEAEGVNALVVGLEAGTGQIIVESDFDSTKRAIVNLTVTEQPSTVSDVRPPLISVTSASVSSTANYQFAGRITDDSGLAEAKFKLNNGTERVFVLDNDGDFLQDLTLDQAENADTVNVLRITAKDIYGNESVYYRSIVVRASNPDQSQTNNSVDNPLAVTVDFDVNPLLPELRATVPVDKVILNMYQEGRDYPVFTIFYHCLVGQQNCPGYSDTTYNVRVRDFDLTPLAAANLLDGQTYYYKAYIKRDNFERTDVSRRFVYRNQTAFPQDLAGRSCAYYFADVTPDHPYCREISLARELGILQGAPDSLGQTVFAPDRPLVRAELFQIAGNIAKLAPATYKPSDGPMFNDLRAYVNNPDANWFMSAIKRMRQSGNEIVTGYSDGTVRPLQTITMAETVKVLLEAGFTTDAIELPRPNFDRSKSPWWSDYFAFSDAQNIAIPRDGLDETLRMDVAYLIHEMYRANLLK